MTQSREEQVSLEQTPFYHCYVRCVRRAYLCGEDFSTGQNYDHRKQWLVSRLRFLSYVFSMDICAYTIMSNHYHVVLHVDQASANGWSDEEVVERWLQLYKGSPLVLRWLNEPKTMDKASVAKVKELIDEWRERLCSISWFMRCVNETIARMANEEDSVKGRFWEGRFKSQALLDKSALLSCMAYVDLNPVRAGICDDLIDSDFTSIQQRLFDVVKYNNNKNQEQCRLVKHIGKQRDLQQALEQELKISKPLVQAPLMPFDGSSHTDIHTALPFTREDYFQLVDETGRCLREDKRGAISSSSSSIISSVGINPDEWLRHIQRFGCTYSHCAGQVVRMIEYAEHFDRRWSRGVGPSLIVHDVSSG